MPVNLTIDAVRDRLAEALAERAELLHSHSEDQVLVQVRDAELLEWLAQYLFDERFYLVTLVGNDERELEDRCFKLYYLFSHPTTDLFVLVEYLLLPPQPETYPSLHTWFEVVSCFEHEICDMLGLRPNGPRSHDVATGSWLHNRYPEGLHPLRRDKTTSRLRQDVLDHDRTAAAVRGGPGAPILPVGPVHAGIIEPGQFRFSMAGEAVNRLGIQLGYTHRGLERLFQSGVPLLDGWWLAEQASGDSSFAHSLAYCRAAETLTERPAPLAAERIRGLFLELERIHNHVADIGMLAEDVALGPYAARLSIVREQLLRLNKRIAGHRYLRRVNRPGGVVLPGELDVRDIRETLDDSLGRFYAIAKRLQGRVAFRARTIGVGQLTRDQAVRLGVTGLVARASGVPRDCRWDHPYGVYDDRGLGRDRTNESRRTDRAEAEAGDVYARFLTRVEEVNESHAIIRRILQLWGGLRKRERLRLLDQPKVLPENNYTFAVGYAEGFRGDVVYWLMQDKMTRIYRCKIRDPSIVNWPALTESVRPRVEHGRSVETMVADFPLVNKSFNLSYAGNDL
ncbi:NADH-quinone oxidoreductase subunit C [Virgisporangium ochraceum]|uniref:Formate hydrogenase HycE n=1 Tax=Virgisporangium ochraceum TaxID=65505 RepID=A0A8J4EDI7_9ACTN|nr:NADH-quinone oxidoreductase subunit C [Virgisporangium ochraceum]GIJ70633.1 formate hydrogenase HycE [Virgisporangium ochraceum]